MSRRRLLRQGVPGGGQAQAQKDCIPVMLKEIDGKGQGLVAARDFEIGDLIFTYNPAIIVKEEGFWKMFLSLMIQLGNLSEEADSTFYRMNEPWPTLDRGSELDKTWLDFSEGYRNVEMTILIQNGEVQKRWSHLSLYLNAALINHSCSPNAECSCGGTGLERLAVVEEKSDSVREIRAIKTIKKGEEITSFYSFRSPYSF